MDLISREQAIEYLENHKKYASENHIILAANEDAIINFLKTKCKKVDSEPVRHGKWIFGATNGHSWMKCNQCLKSQSGQTASFTYCPNCGCKMDVK